MDALPQPEVICTHESDLDGLVSGLLLQRLARHLFGEEVRLEAFHNQNWRQRQLTEKSVWVSDMGFEARLDRPEWVIVDHHQFSHQPRQARLVHDAKKSASLLAYELGKANGLPATAELDRLVRLSDVADLFLEEEAEFVEANDYANLVKSYGFWNLHHLIGGELERLMDHPLLEVMAVKRRVENPLGLTWSKANIQPVTETIGYVETVVGNTNLIVHELLRDDSVPYPVLLTLFRKPSGHIMVSLRSRNGESIHVARQLQGGGHPNAAGASLPRSVNQLQEALRYLRQTLNPKPVPPPGAGGLGDLEAALS